MVRLFLVEDEIAMREGIKHRIPWSENGIDFCGEAGDGELAWPKILEKKPDIVITDIKMPFMDGLELSKLIRRELPDTKIIILSGYDEFEYAQEAIKIGVTDYILKPIMPEDLLNRIQKLAGDIEQEKRQNEERMDWIMEESRERREVNARKLFKALVSGGSSTEQIMELCESLQFRLVAACYQIILISVRMAEGEIDLDYATSIANALHTITDMHEGCYLFEHGIEGFAILLSGNSTEELEVRREKILNQVAVSIKATSGAQYYISMSNPVNRMSELHKAYREANRAYAYRFFIQPDQMVRAEDVLSLPPITVDRHSINTENVLQNENLRTLWDQFLRTGSSEEAETIVDGVFSSVGEENMRSIVFLHYILIDIYITMGRFLKEIGREPKDVDDMCGNLNEILPTLKSG